MPAIAIPIAYTICSISYTTVILLGRDAIV